MGGRGTARLQGDLERVVDATLYLFAVLQERASQANNQYHEMRNERFMLFIWFLSHSSVRSQCSGVREAGRDDWP